jgi:hypothetical protein
VITYFSTRSLELRTPSQSKQLLVASDPVAPRANEIYIAAQNELELIRIAVEKAFPSQPVSDLVKTITAESAAELREMPPCLGAQAFADAALAPAGCLTGQLRELRRTYPHRQHYRFMLVNAFGSNLGDNLLGLTALRQVLSVCRAELPSVTFDVMLGWHSDDRLARQFKGIDGIERVLTQGLTLAELSCYQGLYDTSNLLNLPGYATTPVVDWYMRWMGVDPALVNAADKRNRVVASAACRQSMQARLPQAGGPRFLVNAKASVDLRCMPECAVVQLIEALFARWPTAQVVVLQPAPVDDPRVVNLAAQVPDIDHLTALLASVDAVVGVDTFTSHLADATGTPAVTLYTSTHPDVYPYYPLHQGLLIPAAEQLPAWGKTKVTAEAWAGMADQYLAAWQALDMGDVLRPLTQLLEEKSARPNAFKPSWLSDPVAGMQRLTHRKNLNGAMLDVPMRTRSSTLAELQTSAILNAAAQFVVLGDTVVLVGAGSGEAALDVAQRVGDRGCVVVMEPRQRLHQLLCANLTRAGLWHVQTHCMLPEGEGLQVQQMPSLQLYEEVPPMSFANCLQPEPVVCWAIDRLALSSCRLLVVSAPFVRLAVLQGARSTLERLRPVVVVGLMVLADVPDFEAFFKSLGYQTRVLEIEVETQLLPASSAPTHGVLLAE